MAIPPRPQDEPDAASLNLRKARVTIAKREVIWKGWCSLIRYSYWFSGRGGAPISAVAEISDHGDGVAVLPVDAARRCVVLVRQLRLPTVLNGHPEPLWEVCAGLIDAGETALEAARRELKEETGLIVGALEPAGEIFTCPGSLTERLYLYFAAYAARDRQGDGGGREEEGEDIEVRELPLDEAVRMLDAGEIVDAKTALMLRTLQLGRAELFG